MENKEIIEKIYSFLIEEFEVDPAKIIPEANLKETLGLDSLDYIDLVVVIESNFAFKVKPEDFTNIITFRDFCDYVISRVNSKEPA
ncbi:MAG TPA: phosphopantetheine-binding protein [Chitinophagaceae bacterium]|nr:phosphopantetheine-binding protein [Chitinophagaceae bacterium]